MDHLSISLQGKGAFDPKAGRGASCPTSRGTRGNRRYESGSGRSVSRVRETELEGKNRPLSTRRRTQVAVSWIVSGAVIYLWPHLVQTMPERKIKCSGDSGDGQGCSNCRTSGTPNCEFLRVSLTEPRCESERARALGTKIRAGQLLGGTYQGQRQWMAVPHSRPFEQIPLKTRFI